MMRFDLRLAYGVVVIWLVRWFPFTGCLVWWFSIPLAGTWVFLHFPFARLPPLRVWVSILLLVPFSLNAEGISGARVNNLSSSSFPALLFPFPRAPPFSPCRFLWLPAAPLADIFLRPVTTLANLLLRAMHVLRPRPRPCLTAAPTVAFQYSFRWWDRHDCWRPSCEGYI